MRVLYVNSGNLFGGIETLLVALARFRSSCPEMDPHFALCFEGKLSQELRALGCPVHLLGPVRLSRPWTAWRARHQLRELIASRQFDVVIPHGSWNMGIFGPAVRQTPARLIFWLHDPPRPSLTLLDRLAARVRPDLVICNSRFTERTLDLLYPHVPREVVYCAATPPALSHSPADRSTVRQQFDTPEDATVILQVSRLDPHKGHLLHIEALGQLRDLPGWVCWQVAGPQRPHEIALLAQLKDRATQLGIAGRIRFLDWQPDLARVLAAADVFCQPNSGPEPFGLTFIEAMWSGLPVVTTAMGGPLEILTADCGALVPQADATQLAAVLKRLVTDRDYQQTLARNAPRRATELCDAPSRVRQLGSLLSSSLPAHGVLSRS